MIWSLNSFRRKLWYPLNRRFGGPHRWSECGGREKIPFPAGNQNWSSSLLPVTILSYLGLNINSLDACSLLISVRKILSIQSMWN